MTKTLGSACRTIFKPSIPARSSTNKVCCHMSALAKLNVLRCSHTSQCPRIGKARFCRARTEQCRRLAYWTTVSLHGNHDPWFYVAERCAERVRERCSVRRVRCRRLQCLKGLVSHGTSMPCKPQRPYPLLATDRSIHSDGRIGPENGCIRWLR